MRFASKMGVLLLWILAAALVAYSLMLVFLSNFNMGNLMVWVLTAAITACAIWHKPLAGWLRTGAGRVVGIVLGVLLVVYLALISFVAVSGYANPPTGQEQVMIVLGAGRFYHGRCAACPHAVAQRAALLLARGPGPGVLLGI